MKVTLQLLKDLILEERTKTSKDRKRFLLHRPGDKAAIKEGPVDMVADLAKEKEKEERQEADEEERKEDEKETEEDKEEKEKKRKETEEELAKPTELTEVEVKVPSVFEFMVGITVEREVNLDDVYGLVRAIEGVTIVSTEAERRVISATLERVIIKVKFIKGLTSLRDYKNTLGSAMMQVRGISSLNFMRVRKLPR